MVRVDQFTSSRPQVERRLEKFQRRTSAGNYSRCTPWGRRIRKDRRSLLKMSNLEKLVHLCELKDDSVKFINQPGQFSIFDHLGFRFIQVLELL